ncbi:MAG TPA: MAPEG family protein [Rhizomicrobium sp.]|nr:MAPEG family protein [Rhizomicrobium sp.]
MSSSIGGSVELQILFCAILLGLIQLILAVATGLPSVGLSWAAGPRDEARSHPGRIAGRLERAFENFLETFPFFAASVLLVHVLNKSTHTSVLGSQIYIWARVLYVPAYVIGIPFVRTLIWAASLAGILMVLAALWPGM